MSDSIHGLISSVDLVHPEILSPSQLYDILSKKNLGIEISHSTEKEQLLEIFYRTVLPLPQREYRQNRRGQLLEQKRKKCLEKRKIEPPSKESRKPEVPEKATKVTGENSSPLEPSPRLKAPPSPGSCERKIIKLSSKTCNGSEGAIRSSSVPSPTNSKGKIIKLINDTLMSNKQSSPASDAKTSIGKLKNSREMPTAEDMSPPKKKHKPITWP